MKINLEQSLLDIKGKPLLETGIDLESFLCDDCKNKLSKAKATNVLTLKSIILFALTAAIRGEENIDLNEKTKRFDLAVRILDKSEVELETKDISLIETLIAKAYSAPLIVGQIYNLLEGKSTGIVESKE